MLDEFLANLGLVVSLEGPGKTALAKEEQNAPFTSSCFSYLLLLSFWWLWHEPVPLSVHPPATSIHSQAPHLPAVPVVCERCR